MTQNQTREQLFRIITESSFALDEAIQFLDTHPDDQEALDYYNHYQDIYRNALKEYQECYGPINQKDVVAEDYWTWVKTPWPWEGEC